MCAIMILQLSLFLILNFYITKDHQAGAVDQGHWTKDDGLSTSLWPLLSQTPPHAHGELHSFSHEFSDWAKPSSLENSSSLYSDPATDSAHSRPALVSDNAHLSTNMTASEMYRTKWNHQHIVILEIEPVVMNAANSLFKKHPSKSTLMVYHKGVLQVNRGPQVRLTRQSRVWVVGHGSARADGSVRVGGHGPEGLAKLLAGMESENGRIHMISIVGCHLGKEEGFAKNLLQLLRTRGVETQLQLFASAVSVTPTGEMLTRESGLWRHRDGRHNVFVRLDAKGNILIRNGREGPGFVVPGYQGQALYVNRLDWPSRPQMFVPASLRKKYPYINCLEGLTWSVFYEEQGHRRAPDFIPGNMEAIWLNNSLAPASTAAVTIKHITTILDLVCEIRFNAMEDVNDGLYYVLNNYIYRFHRRTLHTALVGVFINPSDQKKVQHFITAFEIETDSYSLYELRQGLEASEFVRFCRQTFQMRQCEKDCDLWGRYFMEAVFSASVRNFRTFSLFLMTTIACEVHQDDPICTAFVGDDYPMNKREPGRELSRRGFYGGTIHDDVKNSNEDKLKWLEEVLAKENSLYERSTVLMSGVYHDQNTEIDIFARVKVMNIYVFSSFLEFFRGTEEGRRLKRGCVSLPVHH